MSVCAWLTCPYEATHGPYCFQHHRVYGSHAVKTPVKAIPAKSAKRKEEDKVLRQLFKERMAINDRCQLRIKGVCTGKAQGFDHVQKTSPANRLDPKNLKLACNACNLAKELNPIEAKEAGISKSKFKN